MKIAVTGSSGLIGSRFVNLLKDKFDIFPLTRDVIVDITDKEALFKSLDSISPDLIIHLAAKTDVDGCEMDKEYDMEKINKLSLFNGNKLDFDRIHFEDWVNSKSSFAINTVGTKNISEFIKGKETKLIYISTDFVFSGNEEYYTEESVPSPVDWYGQTKYWGEEIVECNSKNYIIVRPSFPYGYKSNVKKDFVCKIIELLQTKDKISLVHDQVVTPTFIDDIVLGLDFLINYYHNNISSGIYHLTGSSFISPYEMGILIADTFSLNKNKIGKISIEEFYQGRAKRPIMSCVRHEKLKQLGFLTKSFEEGLKLIGTI